MSSPPKKGNGTVIALVAGFVAISAAAAGGFLVLKARGAAGGAGEPLAMAPAQPVGRPEPTSAPVVKPEPTTADTSLSPNALPAVAPEKGLSASRDARRARAIPHAKSVAREPAASKPETPAKVTENEVATAAAATPAAGPPGDLGAAMKKEVGDEPAKIPAAASTGIPTEPGNVPQKPSQGAVTGALAAVLPEARACLGPDDAISRASVVFTSSGTVQSIGVSGSAAGKPAEVCIKGALMKAKLQPFAEPTYTANITIRHN